MNITDARKIADAIAGKHQVYSIGDKQAAFALLDASDAPGDTLRARTIWDSCGKKATAPVVAPMPRAKQNSFDDPKATAILFVDGDEFIVFHTDGPDEWQSTFDSVVEDYGGEVALFVWKPKHGIWLREQLSITASKS